MYDSGNVLSVLVENSWDEAHWSSPLQYNLQCAGSYGAAAAGRGFDALSDARYATCYQTSPDPVFIMRIMSGSGRLRGFRVTGNLGCDNRGGVSGNSQPLFAGGAYGWYKTVRCSQTILIVMEPWLLTPTCLDPCPIPA